jgi:hypothetical protein
MDAGTGQCFCLPSSFPTVQKEMNMYKSKVLPAAVGCWLLLAVESRAQDTNAYALAPATRLEALETNTGTVIVKGFAPVGSVSVSAGVVSVTCKEDTDTGAGRKEYGIAITVSVSNQFEDRAIVDYDEMDSLLNAIDYLSKIDWSVTSLISFDAAYTTKGGFRIAAFSSRRSGTIEFTIQSSHMSKGILLAPSQLGPFRGLIDQAKRKLDSIRKEK